MLGKLHHSALSALRNLSIPGELLQFVQFYSVSTIINFPLPSAAVLLYIVTKIVTSKKIVLYLCSPYSYSQGITPLVWSGGRSPVLAHHLLSGPSLVQDSRGAQTTRRWTRYLPVSSMCLKSTLTYFYAVDVHHVILPCSCHLLVHCVPDRECEKSVWSVLRCWPCPHTAGGESTIGSHRQKLSQQRLVPGVHVIRIELETDCSLQWLYVWNYLMYNWLSLCVRFMCN